MSDNVTTHNGTTNNGNNSNGANNNAQNNNAPNNNGINAVNNNNVNNNAANNNAVNNNNANNNNANNNNANNNNAVHNTNAGENEPIYLVVRNAEEQYSIWPAGRDVPAGWEADGTVGPKDACLAHITEVWTDMRPLSLRRRMDLAHA